MFMAIRSGSQTPMTRLVGYRECLTEHGIELREEDILYVDDMRMELAYEETMRSASLFKEQRVGLYVFNDLMAVGVLNALGRLGIRVPEQVQMISMDDIPLARWVHPQLSTVRSPIGQMITDSCDLLVRLIAGEQIPPRTNIYQPVLVLRETTAPASSL